jgi:hypothetical protein
MKLPAIDRFDWGVHPVTVYVLDAVVHELRGLARDKQDVDRAVAAQHAFSILDSLQKRPLAEELSRSNTSGRVVFAKGPEVIPPPLDPESVDHQQIALAQAHLTEGFCAIVTRDREMADIAMCASPPVPVITAPSGGMMETVIRQQLVRQIHWWKLSRREKAEKQKACPVKPARQRSKTDRERRAKRLERVISNLYGRVRSMRHRAVLSIAPLEARLALTAHLVRVLTQHKNRVVFLFTEDQAQAAYWAGELRKRCELPSGAVRVFSERGLPRVHGVRVVAYRHAHIERLYNRHAARFADAGRRITAIVDGCDLLDPVWIATLLFGCDQFIGYTHCPLGHTQTTASRMLAAFFQQQIVATYTFADAEEDGWLRPFDLLRHPIALQEDELQMYREMNDQFITVHNEVIRRYPELDDATDFWEALHRLLGRVVDYEAATLFTLQEQREGLAHRARAKCEVVVDLLSEAGRPARCLILDVERLWTKVLRKTLTGRGMVVEVLKRSSDAAARESLWRRFERRKVDCLILQDVPPVRLVRARINRLIIMTPLTPLCTLAAAVDWALSHAVGGPAMYVACSIPARPRNSRR